ncbi:response regulator [Ramlibacter alkalitolerans]|jgi:two-component system response regulator DesR|uniref:Response regulator transcription factor n=1 Tax=Ramlibacter alkalitolerans TaxID=2039631 RepID=A0ABS1JVH3_9BURK|nr:response regulator transcription factor [Ramlibacter alkalitolerans]MBL0428204.1 response regulator transcription factor [Ramlibacter alkalitolerans]
MSTSNASLKVFLAEDSAPIRERLHGVFARARMDVVGEAATPEGAIDQILSLHPDVVVLDIQLEGGTGMQVLKAVRQADPKVAFVVFSNNSTNVYRSRYLKEGAAGFVDKSTEFDQLPQAVASAGASTVH